MARELGEEALHRLWLCDTDPVLRAWRRLDPRVRLVDSIARRRVLERPRAATLHAGGRGIDALNLRGDTWTPRPGRGTRAPGCWRSAGACRRGVQARLLLRWGIDGLYSDHVDRLSAPGRPPEVATLEGRRGGRGARGGGRPDRRSATRGSARSIGCRTTPSGCRPSRTRSPWAPGRCRGRSSRPRRGRWWCPWPGTARRAACRRCTRGRRGCSRSRPAAPTTRLTRSLTWAAPSRWPTGVGQSVEPAELHLGWPNTTTSLRCTGWTW